tara:strand:+ start:250 stop:444 length:195 start_codon:yes stop_codon:yes gene_type:complete
MYLDDYKVPIGLSTNSNKIIKGGNIENNENILKPFNDNIDNNIINFVFNGGNIKKKNKNKTKKN